MSDITRAFHHGNTESDAAHKSLKGQKEHLRNVVLNAIADAGEQGLTCDEAEVITDTSHQGTSARMTELKKKNLITDTGRRRKTRSGRQAAVYVVVRLKPVDFDTTKHEITVKREKPTGQPKLEFGNTDQIRALRKGRL